MEMESLKCPVCINLYDRKSYVPKILPCNHTLCSVCLEKMIVSRPKCPLDNTNFPDSHKSVNSFNTNLIVLQVIEESQLKNNENCKQHQRPMEFVCLTCNNQICDFCAIFTDHKTHNITPKNELSEKAGKKMLELNSTLQTLCTQYQRLLSESEEIKHARTNEVKEKFDRLRLFLDQKEKEVCLEIEEYATTSRNETQSLQADYTEIRDSLTSQISVLKSLQTNSNEYLKALTDGKAIDLALGAFQSYVSIVSKNKEFNIQIEKRINGLEQSITSVFQQQPPSTSINQANLREKSEETPESVGTSYSQTIYGSDFQISSGTLKNVSTLELRFKELKDGDSCLTEFWAQNVWANTHIKQLRLYLYQFVTLRDGFFFNKMGEALGKMKNLTSIDLRFGYQVRIENQALSALFESLSSVPTLQDLALDMYDHSFNNPHVEWLASSLQKITSFQKLAIKSNWCPGFNDEALKFLAEHLLLKTNKLKQLYLEFPGSSVSDEGIKHLCKGLNQNAANLETLTLYFYKASGKVSDISIEAITENVISKAIKLEEFKLNVVDYRGEPYSNTFTDSSVQKLFTELGNKAKNLKTLTVGLVAIKLTDKSKATITNYKTSHSSVTCKFDFYRPGTPFSV